MFKRSQISRLLSFLFLAVPVLTQAQTGTAPPPPPPPPLTRFESTGTGIGSGSGYSGDEEQDDTKITGATVRGRVVYEDTGRPVRYALIGLAGESVESRYSMKFVKTDESGNFVMKNVKPGNYTTYVKGENILTPQNSNLRAGEGEANNPNSASEKFAVSGLGEIQISVQARRGGAVSGRIAYADGESAAGVKVEVLRKAGERFVGLFNYGESIGSGKTDDRGVYRLAGLPEGTYVLRVVEPSLSNKSQSDYGYNQYNNSDSMLKTYYPEGESSKAARPIDIAPGQEQTSIDVILPERQLYAISGRIISKKERQPLAQFNIYVTKVSEPDEKVINYGGSGSSTKSKKSGAWTLESLPKGKYTITVSQGYTYRDSKSVAAKTPEYPNVSKEIEITDKNLDDLNLEIPAASNLSGTITVEGGADAPREAAVFAINIETQQLNNSNNFNGNDKAAPAKAVNFRVGKLSAGKYRLAFTGRNYYVKSISFGGRDVTHSPIEINEGEDAGGVQIVLSNNVGTLKGKVAGYETGQRIFVVAYKSGVKFEDLRFSSEGGGGAVGQNGEYEIKLPPGDYSVIVLTQSNQPKTEAEAKNWFAEKIKDAASAAVKAGESQTLNLTLPK